MRTSVVNNISRIVTQLVKGPDTNKCHPPDLDIKPLLMFNWASMPCEVHWYFYGHRKIFPRSPWDPWPHYRIMHIADIFYCLLHSPVQCALSDAIDLMDSANISGSDERSLEIIVTVVLRKNRPAGLNDQIVHQLKEIAGMFAWNLVRFRVQFLCRCGQSLFDSREDEWRLWPEQCDAHAPDEAFRENNEGELDMQDRA